jgi:Na+/melibiose symporter-like transporter
MALLEIDQLPVLFTLMGLYGIGNAAAVFGSWAMIADTIEFGEWKTGLRLEGVRYGIYGFFIKLGLGLGLWLAAKSLDWWGYVPNEAQNLVALGGIRQLVSVVPLAWVIVAWLLMWRYSLTEGRHEEIRAELAIPITD